MAHVTLRIGTRLANGEVPVTLTSPAGGEAEGRVRLGEFVGAFDAVAVQEALNNTQDRQRAEAIGKGLFERLFPVGSDIRATWDGLSKEERLLPLELVVDDDGLRAYPWEFLLDADDRRQARLGGIVRRAAAKALAAANADWPFRLLIITGVDDAALPAEEKIGVDVEVDTLRRAMIDFGRSIDIQVLARPSHPDIKSKLDSYQPHVLHFIGHGSFDEGRRKHCVIIEHSESTWNWTTDEIGEDLDLTPNPPRLVFLNCCRSAAERVSTLNLQATFSGRGVPAVVAMQADVRGDKAAGFATAFYKHALIGPAITEPLPTVIDAVRIGRDTLGSLQDIDWGLPTLTYGQDVPIEFTLRTRPAWPADPNFRRCREFDDARVYADAGDARRDLVHWFYPVRAKPQPNILILLGPQTSGKTRLLHWCMESWAVANSRLRCLDVNNLRGANCVGWLTRLRAGSLPAQRADGDRFLRSPLDLEPFRPFYDAVSKALELTVGPNKIDDANQRIAFIDKVDTKVTDDLDATPLYEAFLDGLQKAGPLVVVFDQVSASAIDPTLFEDFRDALLTPLTRAKASNVRVALAMTPEDYNTFGLNGFDEQAAKVVRLKADQSPSELEQLAVEALRFRNENLLRQLANVYVNMNFGTLTGLGRLTFCQQLLNAREFSSLERMR
jgi:hypothetical protein